MERMKKNRAISAKKENIPTFKRYNVHKSVDFKNRIPSFNQSNNKKFKIVNFNDKAPDDPFINGKKIKLKLGMNNNNKGNVKFKENDRYKNLFNKPTGNLFFNNHNKNMPLNMLPNINNKSFPFNKQQHKINLISQKNLNINPIVPLKIMNNNNINNNINLFKSVDNKNLVNIINNNNKINININNNNNKNEQIKINVNNNINKNFINNITLKINPQQEQNNNKNRGLSEPKRKISNFILMSKTNANGLANIGATCYMNATLQCLAHIQRLTYHLLNSETKKKISSNKTKYKLTSAYLTVLENLWQNKNIKYYSPNQFKDVISEMNSLFAGVQANDSKDLILFLLETMHKELNVEYNNLNDQDNNIDNMQTQYNYELTFQNFTKYFKDKFNSAISHLFYAMFNSIMCCQNCNVVLHNVQCYNILIFPLQRVKEYKMKTENIVDLYECFDYHQRPDLISGKTYYCNNCRQMVDNVNTTKLLYGPKILVINFNRGRGLEFDVKINFPEYMDLTNYVYYKQNMPTFYELVGVVTHFGPSSMGGHFIAFCKSFGNQQWYRYNDAMVDPSSFEDAKNTGVPYILFYSYIKR